VATDLASLNQIVGELKDRSHPGMARQSLHQRFGTRSTAFLIAVLGDLMQQRCNTAAGSSVSSLRTASTLRVECIPLSGGDEPHPFAQDRIWYEVDATITKNREFVPIAVHATHGNYQGDGELIRQNPVWKNHKAEDDTGQPATRSESKPEGDDKPQPEAEGRSR